MKIKLDNKTYFDTGFALAKRGRYTEALPFFNKAATYQSDLNRLVLLFKRRDVYYANDLYYRACAKYGETHNLWSDLSYAMGVKGKDLTSLAEKSVGSGCDYSPDKISANKRKLIRFDKDVEDGEDWSDEVTIEEIFNSIDGEGDDSAPIYRVNSPEYFDALRSRLENAFLCGKLDEGHKCVEEIMQKDSDYLPFLELKLMLMLMANKTDDAAQLAKRICNNKDLTISGAFSVASALAEKYPADAEAILDELAYSCDDLEEYHLRTCMEICTRQVKNYQLAADFADYVLRCHEDFHFEMLKVCAIAFYNNGETDLARKAAKTILTYVPGDFYVRTLIDFFAKYPNSDGKIKLEIDDGLFMHFSLPRAVLDFACEKIQEEVNDKTFLYLDALINAIKSSFARRVPKKIVMTVQRALENTAVRHLPRFEEFARDELCQFYADDRVNAMLLESLLELGKTGSVCVNFSGCGTYFLDLDTVRSDDAQLQKVLCIIASQVEYDMNIRQEAEKSLEVFRSGSDLYPDEIVKVAAEYVAGKYRKTL